MIKFKMGVKMKEKQTKHFVLDEELVSTLKGEMGTPVCKCFGRSIISGNFLSAFPEEIAKTKRGVTCGNCRRTRIFRKIK